MNNFASRNAHTCVNWLVAYLATCACGVIVPSKNPSCWDANEVPSHELWPQLLDRAVAAPCFHTLLTNLTSKPSAGDVRHFVQELQPMRRKVGDEKQTSWVAKEREATQEPHQPETNKGDKGYNAYLARHSISFRVPANIEGLGKRSGVAGWSIVVTIPPTVAFLLAYVTQVSRGQDMFLPINAARVIIPLCGAVVCSFWAGGEVRLRDFHPEFRQALQSPSLQALPSGRILIVFSILSLSLACTVLSFRAAHVDFGWPGINASFRNPFGLIVKMLLIAIVTQFYFGYLEEYENFERNFLFTCLLHLAQRFVTCAYMPPGFSLIGLCAWEKYWELYSFSCWGDTTGACGDLGGSIYYPRNALAGVYFALCCGTPYARDRKFVAMTGFAISYAFRFGGVYFNMQRTDANYSRRYLLIYSTGLAVFAYLSALFGRCQRVLPQELQTVGFVRLGFLRKMNSEQIPLKRFQEMPADAFGDVTKATTLIIVSHRWLDRFECDVATAEYPNGFRLTTMCQKLEAFYPVTWAGFRAADRNFLYAMWMFLVSLHVGEFDVLIFFDFMCIPQIGRAKDGSLIERTVDEQKTFDVALPEMGGLYTMYAVMVCPEVPEGMPSYDTSGWCFCEWETAYVSDQLKQYSFELLAKHLGKFGMDGLCGEEEFRIFEEELRMKSFYFENDRITVRGIVQGNLIRSTLIDAVANQTLEVVEQKLHELSDHGLISIIRNPIDAGTLDSLLHIAVRLPSKEIVDLLISKGAQVDARNWAGDTPWQLFLIPRFWNHFV